ncbi:phasin [Methylorubrum aminovorans]
MNITQPSFALPAELRDFAEKSVEQARAAFTAVLHNTRKATESVQAQTRTAELPANVAYMRSLDLLEQNLAATFDLTQKLVRANSLQDALQLQSDYVRTQFAALQNQSKELVSATQPVKTA